MQYGGTGIAPLICKPRHPAHEPCCAEAARHSIRLLCFLRLLSFLSLLCILCFLRPAICHCRCAILMWLLLASV